MTTWPWRRVADRARAEREAAERRREQAKAEKAQAMEIAERARWWLEENHISPKIQRLYRGT